MGNAFCGFRILASLGVLSAIRYGTFAAVLSTSYAGFAAEAPLRADTPPVPAPAPAPTVVPAPAYVVRVQPYSTEAFGPPAGPTVLLPADAPAPPPIPKPFDGLNFGAGIGVTFGQPRVASATVVNNVVRVTESSDVMAGIVLESHYFFVPKIPFLW